MLDILTHSLFTSIYCVCIELEIVHFRLYPGVADALKFAYSRVYIVTTKQVFGLLI